MFSCGSLINVFLDSILTSLPGRKEGPDDRAHRSPCAVRHSSWGNQPLHGYLQEDGRRLCRPLCLFLHLHPLPWDPAALWFRDSLTDVDLDTLCTSFHCLPYKKDEVKLFGFVLDLLWLDESWNKRQNAFIVLHVNLDWSFISSSVTIKTGHQLIPSVCSCLRPEWRRPGVPEGMNKSHFYRGLFNLTTCFSFLIV